MRHHFGIWSVAQRGLQVSRCRVLKCGITRLGALSLRPGGRLKTLRGLLLAVEDMGDGMGQTVDIAQISI